MVALLSFLSLWIWTDSAQIDESIISKKLSYQASCWNAGDINCFMDDYWKSDSLMYIGKNGVTYGWQNTLESYKKRYPTKKEMGNLSFDIVTLTSLNDDHYFMVGRWFLKRENDNLNGHFSLIWKKIQGEWVIIADHSS